MSISHVSCENVIKEQHIYVQIGKISELSMENINFNKFFFIKVGFKLHLDKQGEFQF